MSAWFPFHISLLDVLRNLDLRISPVNNKLIGNGDNQRDKFIPRGIKNLGNTCFMNSILQALSSSPSFLAHLVTLKQYSQANSFSVTLLIGLKELRERSVSGPYSTSSPELIKRKLEDFKGIFRGNNENDAQELFQAVVELLEKERIRSIEKHFKETLCSRGHSRCRFKISGGESASLLDRSRTRPVNPCEGLYAMHMKCITCTKATGHSGFKPVKMEPFTVLPLTIPTPGSRLSQFNDSIDSTSPVRIAGLFGGGMNTPHFKLRPSFKRVSPEVSLESCIDLFLEMEERTDINCESCTLYNVAKCYNSKTSTDSDAVVKDRSTGDDTPTEKFYSEPSIVGSLKLRIMSTRDSFQLDVDNEDMSEKIRGSNSVLYRMLWGKDKGKYLVQQSMVHSTSIAMFPPLLCFHIKRIFFSPSGNLKKDSTKVKFPVILDVNRYVRTPEGNGRVGSNCRSDLQWTNSGDGVSSVSGDSDVVSVSSKSDAGSVGQEPRVNRIANYLLRAVVVHGGTPASGHYVAYCLLEDSPRRVWARFSDQQVDYVDESQVLASEAYMLFYDRAPITNVDAL